MKKTFTQRQIPTLLGMVILIAALVGGIFFIGQGGGVFAPRATAQTTPKKVTVSNVKDDSFTISFLTDDATAGFVKYGTTADALQSQASDDRDQFSGSVGQFTTHHITIHDLQPGTTYYYTLGTTASSKYDNNGAPYSTKTTPKSGTLPIAKTIYGTVNTSSGSPAAGSIVYVNLDGAYQLSALTKDSGSWAIPLANARSATTGEYRAVNPTDQLAVTIQGVDVNLTSTLTTSVENAQPVTTVTLGQDQVNQNSGAGTTQADNSATSPTVSSSPVASPMSSASPSSLAGSDSLGSLTNSGVAYQVPNDTSVSTTSSGTQLTTQTPIDTVVEVNTVKTETVQTDQPVIQGKAVPNVLVSVEIHSEAAINTQVQTDSQGNYSVDLQQLEKQLEPGQHTITVTYTDPNTNKSVTQTKTFTVQSQGLIAAANPSPTPYSTNNPFVIATPSPTPIIATESASPTPTLVATTSTVISKVSTTSAMPRSGSATTTFLLIGGGLFFILAGGFSYWVTARQLDPQDLG